MEQQLVWLASRFWKAVGLALTVVCGLALLAIFVGLLVTTVRA